MTRPELAVIVATLLAESVTSGRVELDRIGELLGASAVSADEIDAILEALEGAGRVVDAPHASALADLGKVLAAVRALKREGETAPDVAAIAARCEIEPTRVRAALLVGRVMGR